MTDRIREFLKARRDGGKDSNPCLVLDLDVVRDNYLSCARMSGWGLAFTA